VLWVVRAPMYVPTTYLVSVMYMLGECVRVATGTQRWLWA